MIKDANITMDELRDIRRCVWDAREAVKTVENVFPELDTIDDTDSEHAIQLLDIAYDYMLDVIRIIEPYF